MRMIVLLCYFCIFGCNQTGHTSAETFLRMKMTAPHQVVLFVVDAGGGIAFGGGADAAYGITTWQGQLNDEQRMRLTGLIDSANWWKMTDAPVIPAATPHYAIQIHRETSVRFDLPISDSSGTAVFDLLNAASLVRLDPYLNTLPKPSMDTIIDRKTEESID